MHKFIFILDVVNILELLDGASNLIAKITEGATAPEVILAIRLLKFRLQLSNSYPIGVYIL